MKVHLLNRVENILAKSEIACFEASERVYMWERVKLGTCFLF